LQLIPLLLVDWRSDETGIGRGVQRLAFALLMTAVLQTRDPESWPLRALRWTAIRVLRRLLLLLLRVWPATKSVSRTLESPV
jgi:hypothetical protein